MFPTDFNYKSTRYAHSGSIKLLGHPKLDLVKDSFRWRAANYYNQLPSNIKNLESLEKFKVETKKWISENIPICCSQN